MTKNTFKQSKTNDKYRGIFSFEFDDKSKDGGEPEIPEKIHLIPMGQWDHDLYGPIIINNADIREFIQNFNAGIRKGVFITAGHEGFEELPAVGWVTEVEARDTGLWGTVAWNDSGKELLKQKAFKFFSPEMCRDYEDPQTHEYYRNVMTGGALTKSPYFKELEAIVFSEPKLKSNFKHNENMTKSIDEVLALDITALSDEDKAVLKENADKLTDEQKVTYASVLEVKATEDEPEPKTAEEKQAEEEANIAAGLNPDGSAKDTTTQEHSDKNGNVVISASEYKALQKKANEGAQAFAAMEKAEITNAFEKMVFSATNKNGKFLPKVGTELRKFMEGLKKDQREAFSVLVASIPSTAIFNEVGGADAVDGTAQAEVDSKIAEKMKLNDKMTYSGALKQVMAENKGLEERYDSELVVSKK